MPRTLIRCPWATREPELTYHDEEWGVPEHDDNRLFELLTLEGAQAGLSWETILLKRAGYNAIFLKFDARRVARFTEADIDAAVVDARIVRHRGKIASTVKNARAVLAVQSEFGSLDAYLWTFVDGRPVIGINHLDDDVPGSSTLSALVSKDLKKRGFTFVGSTTVHAFLQAAGIINDHRIECFRFKQIAKAGAKKAT